MKRHSLSISLAVLLAGILFTACGHRQHLNVSKNQIVFSYAGGSDFFNVTADCPWIIVIDNIPDWLTIDPLASNDTATSLSVALTASPNETMIDRNAAFAVISENGKINKIITVTQEKIDINPMLGKVWFLRFYERWNTDYWDNYIPESYRTWTYYSDYENEKFFFYFNDDDTGYQIYTQADDTVYYPFQFEYFPETDSLEIAFETTNNTVEDYHAIIHQLNNSDFSFSNGYVPKQPTKSFHYFEKLNMVNVSTGKRQELKVNPKKIAPKPAGPLIKL